MKTTRQCPHQPDARQDERPLTIDEARHPLLPWLPADDAPGDYEDIEYAARWVQSHAPVASIGTLQAPSTVAERPRQKQHKKAQ